MTAEGRGRGFVGRTAWVRSLSAPMRRFIATENASALILLVATLIALLWANSPWGETYEQFWSTELSFRLGANELALDLRHWVNDALMALFFFVVGLEIRREWDMGELRERRRVATPVIAAIGGLVVPSLIYVALNAGQVTVRGWGIPIGTDTAFALGVLTLVGSRGPARVRTFLLTTMVVDDIGALSVVAFAYTEDLSVPALLVAFAIFGVLVGIRGLGMRHGMAFFLGGFGVWLATLLAGVHPTVAGLALGLLASAHPPSRESLQRAGTLWRLFREQPNPAYARTASRELMISLSPNERLEHLYHPWTSLVVVPIFALANAGVQINGEVLARAFASPVTLGIIFALVVGKVVGIMGATWLATRPALGGFPLTVPWTPLLGTATVSGIGFTVSLLIADLIFDGDTLEEAKIGIFSASIVAALLAWVVFGFGERMPSRQRTPVAKPIIDLADPVDHEEDHIRGSEEAAVTLVEYGDFECPYCGRAEPVIRELLGRFGAGLRFVFRHLPLSDVHDHAELAAEAAEAAAAQGRFWEMHDLLLERQQGLTPEDLLGYAEELGLDVDRFTEDLRTRRHRHRVVRDVDSADRSGVSGTPTFFINGRRHHGPYDVDTLTNAVQREASAIARRSSD